MEFTDLFTEEGFAKALQSKGSGKLEPGESRIIMTSGYRNMASGVAALSTAYQFLNFLPNGGSIPQIVSSSANDIAAGSGWDQVEFAGWDADGDYITETVQMTGAASAAFADPYTSIDWEATRPVVVGSTNSNFGIITLYNAAFFEIASIAANTQAFQCATFKVPVGHTARVFRIEHNRESITTGEFGIQCRYSLGGTEEWRVLNGAHDITVMGAKIIKPVKVELSENTEIQCIKTGGGTGEIASAKMYILLTRNPAT